jgi:hypothetical protein
MTLLIMRLRLCKIAHAGLTRELLLLYFTSLNGSGAA